MKPDIFSCKNCAAYRPGEYMKSIYAPEYAADYPQNKGWAPACVVFQQRGLCAKAMLARAIEIGAAQIHIHTNAPDTSGWRVIDEPSVIAAP